MEFFCPRIFSCVAPHRPETFQCLLFIEQLLFLQGVKLIGWVYKSSDFHWIISDQTFPEQVLKAPPPVHIKSERRLIQVHENVAETPPLAPAGFLAVDSGVTPRRLAQTLPQRVVIGQTRPHTRGQTQIGCV